MRVARVVNIYKSVFRGGNGWMCKCQCGIDVYRCSIHTVHCYTKYNTIQENALKAMC